MSFISNLGSKITKGGQAVSSGVKYAADLAKLNAGISSQKKKINELYAAVGEKYVELHAREPEEALAAYIDDIAECKREMARLNDEIKKVKGVAICPYCESEIVSESRFCNICGKELPVADSYGDFVEES